MVVLLFVLDAGWFFARMVQQPRAAGATTKTKHAYGSYPRQKSAALPSCSSGSVAADLHQPDLRQPPAVHHGLHEGTCRLAAAVGGRSWIQQPQPVRRHRIPGDVAVPEHQD